MRDGADGVRGGVLVAAGAVARAGGVVCQVAGEDARVGREGEVLALFAAGWWGKNVSLALGCTYDCRIDVRKKES